MIRSFRDKGLQRLAERGDPSRLSVQKIDRIERMLARLAVARQPEELNLPGWRFHALSGKSKGRYSLTVSGNWRLTFAWSDEDAVDLDLEDYH